MIQLTDEGGKDTQQAIADLEERKLPSLFSYRQAYFTGAKTQLKKIHDWGDEDCPHSQGRYLRPVKRQCSKCWQALLEEIK